ncbi:hypothetical protein G6F56_002201 [Rhizopus delemar]|nr:hypothetical protein G6F56_002201 [Rhizopus delemar]
MSKGKKKEMNKFSDTSILDEDMWVPPIKQRRRFSPEESHILEREYASNSSPTQEKIQQIANSINTPRKIVTTWFQNRRAKNKRKERIRMQENINSMSAYDSATLTSELHAPENPSTSFDSKGISLVYKNHSLKHGNSLPTELSNTYTLNDTSNTTNPSLLLSSSEFAYLYRAQVLDQHSIDQTSHQPFFPIHHPSTLAPDNDSSMRQQCTSEPYPSYSFEETERLYSNAIGDKNSYPSYIPFYRSNAMTTDTSFSSSFHTCIKPTDLLLEYYNEGRSLLNIHDPDNIMVNHNTDNDMKNTINSTSAVCFEELMLMASLDVPQKDQ